MYSLRESCTFYLSGSEVFKVFEGLAVSKPNHEHGPRSGGSGDMLVWLSNIAQMSDMCDSPKGQNANIAHPYYSLKTHSSANVNGCQELEKNPQAMEETTRLVEVSTRFWSSRLPKRYWFGLAANVEC